MGTFGTLCNVLMFILHNWCKCHNTDICLYPCFSYVINWGIPSTWIVAILNHQIVTGVGARSNKGQDDLDDHGYDIQAQYGYFLGDMGIVDVNADKKGQSLADKYQVCNNLGWDWSAAECVYCLVLSDHVE
jgi:hypothetical protein